MSTSSHHLDLNPSFDEHRWIIQIQRALEIEDPDQESNPNSVSIFTIPKPLFQISPESYVPQNVSLGPYHHWQPELHATTRYKIFAARRSQKNLNLSTFHTLVDHLVKFEAKFRTNYHKYLNFSEETLSWMMAIDSCFLLEFLQFENVSCNNLVIRDIIMLENQIPMFVLREVVEFHLGSSNEADEFLYPMLMGFYKKVSPLRSLQETPDIRSVMKSKHLLDLLYRIIVPREVEQEFETLSSNDNGSEPTSFQKIPSIIRRVLISKPVKAFTTLLWKLLLNLPGTVMMRQVEYLIFSQDREPSDSENKDLNKPPLMEEIAVPSVTELFKAGVKFSTADSGIFGIEFDKKMATLYLPQVCLDENTEVVIKNLVAYEACISSGPLVFTRYTELMNGIIDTAEDTRILREQGIILNRLKCDGDVADLWNKMSKSIRSTKVPFLDKAIEDVNGYYNGRWTVRIGEFLENRVRGSWQVVMSIVIVLFMGLQVLGIAIRSF